MASEENKKMIRSIRNWTELPEDVTASILSRLGAFEIIKNAQKVCVTWRNVCKNPLMWRTIDLSGPFDSPYMKFYLEKMCRHVIDRSSGNLLDIRVGHFATNKLLNYITQSSSGIKRLQLVNCYGISDEGLTEAASKLPLLEELDISLCSVSHKSLQVVGRCCPLLKSFKLNQTWKYPNEPNDDMDALAVAGTMHGLRHLQLVGNKLTDAGLTEILDCCPHLQSLDLPDCWNLRLGGDLGRRCAQQIKELQPPELLNHEFLAARDAFDQFNSFSDYDSDGDLSLGDMIE